MPSKVRRPPARFSPSARPSLLAWVPSGRYSRSPVSRRMESQQSPAAHTRSVTRPRGSGLNAPWGPRGIPLPVRKPVDGSTPSARTTRSHGRDPPVQWTPTTSPSSTSNPVTSASSTTSTPASDSASATRSDISGSSELITRDRVTTVTPKPRRSAASATSMPTYPAPTITTWAPGSAASNRSSHAAPSSSVCTAPTRSYGVPSACECPRRNDRVRAAGHHQLVELDGLSRGRRDLTTCQVDIGDRGPEPQVDPRGTVLLGGPRHQGVAGVHVAGHPVRDPAGGVRRVPALVEHGDRQLPAARRGRAQRLVSGRHAGGVGPDDHDRSAVTGSACQASGSMVSRARAPAGRARATSCRGGR